MKGCLLDCLRGPGSNPVLSSLLVVGCLRLIKEDSVLNIKGNIFLKKERGWTENVTNAEQNWYGLVDLKIEAFNIII